MNTVLSDIHISCIHKVVPTLAQLSKCWLEFACIVLAIHFVGQFAVFHHCLIAGFQFKACCYCYSSSHVSYNLTHFQHWLPSCQQAKSPAHFSSIYATNSLDNENFARKQLGCRTPFFGGDILQLPVWWISQLTSWLVTLISLCFQICIRGHRLKHNTITSV